MRLYGIVGKRNSELEGMIFGHFTTRKLAEIGFQHLPKEFQEETAIVLSNLAFNTVEVDGKIIDLTANRSCKEIIQSLEKEKFIQKLE